MVSNTGPNNDKCCTLFFLLPQIVLGTNSSARALNFINLSSLIVVCSTAGRTISGVNSSGGKCDK